MEDKELKKRLKKIPDADKNGDPIYKIAVGETSKKGSKTNKKDNKGWNIRKRKDNLFKTVFSLELKNKF